MPNSSLNGPGAQPAATAPGTVQLAAKHLEEIAAHGERDYPYECCGLLLGNFGAAGSKMVSQTYSISNARDETARRNRFLITPDELRRGERYAAEKQLEVVGFYHSHPDHPAAPSAYDLDHAWPVYSYVIVSVRAAQAFAIRSWSLRSDRSSFIEEEILKGN